jgi:hypothetical protein
LEEIRFVERLSEYPADILNLLTDTCLTVRNLTRRYLPEPDLFRASSLAFAWASAFYAPMVDPDI